MNKPEAKQTTALRQPSLLGGGKPVAPATGRQGWAEKRQTDPSSACRGSKYPIPAFFEYRTNPRGFDFI